MKKIFLVIGLVGIVLMQFQNARAQYVTIPDANFVTWLQDNGYADCMNGDELDTTCSNVVNGWSIECYQSNISDLTGIQYFDNLEWLSCDDNLLTSLPVLPGNLIGLSCAANQLTSLPILPNSLTGLYCAGNQLSELPTLPSNLLELNCNDNELITLPILPSTLTSLECAYNQIDDLEILPNSLSFLSCGNNQLTFLPILPDSLSILWCAYNQLSNLPDLPNNIIELGCSYNQLSSIPFLPTTLTDLACDHNQLVNLPPLPDGLDILFCHNNQLTDLPNLPDSLYVFMIHSNPIQCMPPLYAYTGNQLYFNVSSTGITCFPNVIQHPNISYFPAIDTMLICQIGDPCSIATCDAPTNPSANNVSSTSALIKWNMENDAVKYRVRVKNMSTGVNNLYFVNAPDTTKSLTNLSANTTYQVKVRSQCSTNGSILSPWSNTITFTTSGATTCIYPTNLVANPTSNSTATIVWTPISGAAGYQLRYKQSSASSWNLIPINNGSTSSYNLTSLSPNTTYKYQLRTKCSINPLTWSNFSPIQTFTTPLRLGEEEIINSIQLYPNPSNGNVTFNSNASTGILHVYDMVGKEILQQVVSSQTTLSNLPNGLLTYRFVSENGLVKTNKFVVIK